MGCFFGKLVKMAQGYASTHARTALIDFDRLALWGKEAGLSSALVNSIAKANTAREVLELLHPCQQWEQVVSLITSKALHMAKTFARQDIDIKYYIFDFQGTLLHSQGRPTSRINTPFVV
jgi:cobalt-precorrin-5B (C1)-methyltransferase